jgi:hypothetical protein
MKHVADVERGNFVLAKAHAERHREDDLVPEAIAMLAGDLQERSLLELGQRPRQARDGGGIRGHRDH